MHLALPKIIQPIIRKPRLIVVFGRSGSGKDTVATILERRLNCYTYHGDLHNSPSYLKCLQMGEMPTQLHRDVQCLDHASNIQPLLSLGKTVIMNWVFLHRSQRDIWRKIYPHSEFVYVYTSLPLITKRLRDQPRLGHNISSDHAIKIAKQFEEPTNSEHLDAFFVNEGSHQELEKQVRFWTTK